MALMFGVWDVPSGLVLTLWEQVCLIESSGARIIALTFQRRAGALLPLAGCQLGFEAADSSVIHLGFAAPHQGPNLGTVFGGCAWAAVRSSPYASCGAGVRRNNARWAVGRRAGRTRGTAAGGRRGSP